VANQEGQMTTYQLSKAKRLPSYGKDSISLLVVYLFYFMALLGVRPLNVPDEGLYPEVARQMLLSHDFITPKVNGIIFLDKPILYYWLEALAMGIFGVNEWAIRLWPALFGIFGCLMVYWFGRKLFDRATGLLASGLLAVCPLYYLSAHYANMDLQLAVWISGSLFSFIIALQYPPGHKRRLWMWLAFAAAAGGTLTEGLISIVLPGLVIGCWIMVTRQWRLLAPIYLPSGLLIYLLLTLPWYIMAQLENPEFFNYFFIYQQIQRYAGTGFNNPLPFWFYLPIILIGLFPGSAFLVQSLKWHIIEYWQAHTKQKLILMLILWPMLMVIFFSIPSDKTPGYILPVLPPLVILLAHYLNRITQHFYWSGWVIYGSLALLFALGLVIAPWFNRLPDHLNIQKVEPYLIMMAACLVLGVVAVTWFLQHRQWSRAMRSILISSGATMLVTLGFAATLAVGTIKPLALALKPYLKPDDKVVTYFTYPQDLAIYLNLNQPILVIDNWRNPHILKPEHWRKEFYLGGQHSTGSGQILLQTPALPRLLVKTNTLYIFTRESDYKELESKYGLFLWGQYEGKYLLSNRRPPSDFKVIKG
jgi:4-amino-4-deoxy-L-arabinose transferase-like glycosyltransferase